MQIRMTLLGPIPAEYGSGIHLHLSDPCPRYHRLLYFIARQCEPSLDGISSCMSCISCPICYLEPSIYSNDNDQEDRGVFMYRKLADR